MVRFLSPGMSYLFKIEIPDPTIALYFLEKLNVYVAYSNFTHMSDIEIILSIFLMPSQCKTSGINP